MTETLVAVTGSQEPYIFDLPHVLSLPNGFEFRFRYSHKWVDAAIHRQLKLDPSAFYGTELILCFHSQDSRRVFPIRRCTVISVEEIGPVIFLRFSVGDFPRLEQESPGMMTHAGQDAALDILSAQGKALLGLNGNEDLSDALPTGRYFLKAQTRATLEWSSEPLHEPRGKKERQSESVRAWSALAVAISTEKALAGVPLFHLLGFDRENGERLLSSPVKNKFSLSRAPIHGFKLTAGERYRLRLLEWCDPGERKSTARFRVNCAFASAGLALEGASNLVVGRYDILEYTFRAERSGYGEILVFRPIHWTMPRRSALIHRRQP